MKNLKHLPSMLSIVFLVTSFNVLVLGQSEQLANVTSLGSSVRFDLSASCETVTLSVLAPDGRVFSKEFKCGTAPEFRLGDTREKYPDGQYTYELRLTPAVSATTQEELKAARAKGTSDETQRDLKRRGVLPTAPVTQSGGFAVLNGSIVVSRDTDDKSRAELRTPAKRTVAPEPVALSSSSVGHANYKVNRHHPAFLFFDFVIADDLIVQGSACVGLDCVDGENFGFDTIRVKENNTRIQFDDTSTSAGFPNNNWQIRANASGSGGGNFLAFVDQGATGNSETGTIVFEVDAGAPANSLRVSSGGNIGIGTATPVLDIHDNATDTPAIRLEQNNSGGFTAQTWDVAGNEANFFVRDVTSGSRLPFRIRPGAPTSSIDIAASGNVGIGTASPSKRLHVAATNAQIFVDRPANTAGNYALINFGTNSVEKFLFGLNADSDVNVDKLSFFDSAFGATPVMTFTGGNIGIGTQSPTQKLSVNGTAGKSGGGTWDVFSDIRLKKIRGTYNSGLSAVMRLQPLRYEYKPDNALGITSDGEHIGFSAQDVQKVMPEAVTTTTNGYLMVRSDPILWSMLNAIKEQQKEIVELKRQIRQLRATRRRR
ncbi:MAG TPA: tail fiber domain-containing protein [Pyrinomonadaceae bacterium]